MAILICFKNMVFNRDRRILTDRSNFLKSFSSLEELITDDMTRGVLFCFLFSNPWCVRDKYFALSIWIFLLPALNRFEEDSSILFVFHLPDTFYIKHFFLLFREVTAHFLLCCIVK